MKTFDRSQKLVPKCIYVYVYGLFLNIFVFFSVLVDIQYCFILVSGI